MKDAENMKSIGIKMSILMGITLSFSLSLTGNLSSGRFSIPAFLSGFVISLIISLVIGFLVPMGKLGASFCRKLGLNSGTLGARLFESLISDIVYTPLITFIMVTMAYKSAVSHGAKLSYLPMLGKSLIISLVVGYILIFIFMPLYLKLLTGPRGKK